MIKFMAKIGEAMKEDKIETDGVNRGSTGPANAQEAEKQYKEIMTDLSHPYHNALHAGHKEAQKKVQSLFSMAHPESA